MRRYRRAAIRGKLAPATNGRSRWLVRTFLCLAILPPASATSTLAESRTYRLDRAHTVVTFTVGYTAGITEVLGRFRDFAGELSYDPTDGSLDRVEVTFQTVSIDTGHDGRDADLKTENWFDVERYPEIRFVSTAIEPDEYGYSMEGVLTIKAVRTQIHESFRRTHEPTEVWAHGRPHIGFEARLVVDRRDYQLPEQERSGVITSIGELFIREEVVIEIAAQAIGPGIDTFLFEAILESGFEAAKALYHRLEEEHRGKETYSFEAPPLALLVPRLVERQKTTEALQLAEFVREIAPESHFAYYALGVAYQALGQEDRARESAEKALEIRPGHRLTERLLRELDDE